MAYPGLFETNTNNNGVYSSGASPTLTRVEVRAFGGSLSNVGVYGYVGGESTLRDVTASASGGTHATGLYVFQASAVARGSTFTSSDATNSYGVGGEGTGCSVTVEASSLDESSGALESNGCVPVSASRLIGGVDGPATCSGVFNAAGTFYANTCP